MKEAKRLEEEEDKLLRSSVEIQSRLLRVREQKRHIQKRQKEMFDRGMADLAEELGDSDPLISGPVSSEPVASGSAAEPVVLEQFGVLPEIEFDEWAREQGLEDLFPAQGQVAGVGQGTGGESSRSRSSD